MEVCLRTVWAQTDEEREEFRKGRESESNMEVKTGGMEELRKVRVEIEKGDSQAADAASGAAAFAKLKKVVEGLGVGESG